METQHWVEEAYECQYLDLSQAEELSEELMQIGRMLNSMIEKAPLFCGENDRMIPDQTPDYLADTDD